MQKLELIEVGYIKKTYKLKGELIIYLNKFVQINWTNIKLLFILNNNSYLPYQISSINLINNQVYILLKNIDNIDKAKNLVDKKCYLLKEFVTEINLNYLEYKVVFNNINYEIVDQLFNGKYWLFKIYINKKYVWIPQVDQYIKKIDNNNKLIFSENILGLC